MAFLNSNPYDYFQSVRRPDTSANPNTRAVPALSAGGGGFTAGVGPATSAVPQHSGGGSSYTNLLSYLGANQDTGATTGHGAANVVQQAYDQDVAAQNAYKGSATSALDKAGAATAQNSDTLSKIDAGGASVDQNTLNKINSGEIRSLDPVTYTGPDYDASAVSYKGPTDVTGFTDQAGTDRATRLDRDFNLSQQGANLGSNSGVATLLRSAFSQPNYTAGENNLDSFLAQGTSGGARALQGVGGLAAQGKASGEAIDKDLSGKIKGYQDQATATNKAYQDAIEKAKARAAATNKTYQDAIANWKPAEVTGKTQKPEDDPYNQPDFPKSVATQPLDVAPSVPGTLITGKQYVNSNEAIPAGYEKPHIPLNKDGTPNMGKTVATNMSDNSMYNGYGLPTSYNQNQNDTHDMWFPGANAVAFRDKLTDHLNLPYPTLGGGFLAHGGRIPSYRRLTSMLRGC